MISFTGPPARLGAGPRLWRRDQGDLGGGCARRRYRDPDVGARVQVQDPPAGAVLTPRCNSGHRSQDRRPVDAIRAIVGHENGLDSIGADGLCHLLDRQFRGRRRAAGGREVLLPEPKRAVDGGLIGKHDNSASDADKFTQSTDGIGPVVDRQVFLIRSSSGVVVPGRPGSGGPGGLADARRALPVSRHRASATTRCDQETSLPVTGQGPEDAGHGGEGRHADSFDDRRGGTVALVDFGEHLCQTEWAQRVTDHAVSGFGGVAMAAGARCEAIEHFEADIVEGP
jgi:hypothetical protein